MASGRDMVICGDFLHSTDAEAVEVLQNKCVGVKDGKIVFIDDKSKIETLSAKHGMANCGVIQLNERQFVIPGFVDTHIHASQYPNAGKGLDLGLLDWLNKYTFPTEAHFSNLGYALKVYEKVVNRVLTSGTTTACYFATIDTEATLVLCDVIEEQGQRALVGKVNMDSNAPDFYVEASVRDSLHETKRFIESVFDKNYSNITPVVTPRFAISCSTDLMQQLADLAKQYDIPIQTHICETRDEVAFVSDLHPEAKHYTDVYDRAGLLTNKTVLAHGIYLTQPEIDVIKERQSAISHCPNSNLSLRSGLLDVQNLIQQDVKVGLGTDVSGGYHPTILDAIRTSIHVSNTHFINNHKTGYQAITVRDAFRLATLGGAKALAMDHVIGNFEVGKEFDALVVDPCAHGSIMHVFDDDELIDCFEKFLFTGDDRNIVSIYVAGSSVGPVTSLNGACDCHKNGR